MTKDTTISRGSVPDMTTASRQRRIALATVTVVGGTLVVNSAPASAATLEVTNADASGPGSLAQAIEDANATPEADTITFASGVTGTITFDDTSKVKYDLTIEGPGSEILTLSKDSGDLLYLYNEAALTVSGLTFADIGDDAIDGRETGAITLGASNFERMQSALEITTSGPVSVSNIVVSDVDRSVRVSDVSGAVDLSDIATSGSGYYSGRVRVGRTTGDVSITDSTLGSVSVYGTTSDDAMMSGNVTIRSVDIGSDARYASVSLYRNAGTATVEDVTISGESYVGLNVGGVSTFDLESTIAGTAEVSNVTFDSADGSARVRLRRLENVTVSDLAGATSLVVSEVESGDLSGATIVGAKQSGFGGIRKDDDELVAEFGEFERDGVVMSFYRSTFDMDQVTVVGHTAGAVMSITDSDVTLSHSTVANNTISGPTITSRDTSVDDLDLGDRKVRGDGSTLHFDHTIMSDLPADGFEFAQVVDGDDDVRRLKAVDPTVLDITAEYSLVPTGVGSDYELGDTNVETSDPKLGPVQNNGGTQLTSLPLPGSPATDAGDPDIEDAPLLDARGEARIVDVIDVGATESTKLLTSIAPARFVDTRTGPETIDNRYEGEGKRQSGSVYTVDIAGRGEVPAGATAVVMNITAIGPEGSGFVTVFACDDEQPNASSLNFAASNVGNEVIAGLADDGSICLFVQGVAHLTVDVVAYATDLSSIRPVTPARSFESRIGQDTADGRFAGAGVLSAGSQTTVLVAGRNGVPADAAAVIVNVTAIRPSSDGFVTVHGCLPERPNASSLNYEEGSIRANEIVVQLDDFGSLCVFTSAETNLAIDVVGYLPTGAIETVAPARLLDTRDNGSTVDESNQGDGQVAAGGSVTLPVAGRAGVPEGVTAVVVNVTAIRPGSRGFVTVDGCVTPRPTASSLNYEAGVNGANEIIAGVNDDGEICLFSSADTDLAVDVVAFIR